jgi:hypothetical protein
MEHVVYCCCCCYQAFEVGGDVLQPQLAHNLCRLIAEQDSELHAIAVRMFMQVRWLDFSFSCSSYS